MSQGIAHKFVKILYKKSYRRVALGVIFTGVVLKKTLKHVLPEDFFLPFYAYDVHRPKVIEAMKLLNRCKRDMGIEPNTFKITAFVSKTSDVCSAGFSAFDMGQSHIGIPALYFCTGVEDMELKHALSRLNPRAKNEQYMSLDPNEIKLAESLLLSTAAKKFAIARHLYYLRTNWALYEAAVPAVYVMLGYVLMFRLPRILFQFGNQSVSVQRIAGATLLAAGFAYILCKLTTSALMRKISVLADKEVASISPEYARGGVELYSKLSQTGSALRVLFGKRGERLYTDEGNIKDGLFPFFSTVAPNFSERIRYLQGHLEPASDSVRSVDCPDSE